MCILPSPHVAVPASRTPAHDLPPAARQQLAVEALAGRHITALAHDHDVSRKFVYRQSALADQALRNAFAPPQADEAVLFYLPVTKQWLRQLVVGLVLICHSSLRGVVELLRDLFDYPMALGTVFNIVHAVIPGARARNDAQDLSGIRIGSHDEIFQTSDPVLVGVDLLSTYCYLLSIEDNRDADTWAIRLLELQEHGFDPDFVVADAGSALRAGQAEVMPNTPCRSDVFHALKEVQEVVTKLENRAYQAMTTCTELAQKLARYQQRHGRTDRRRVQQLSHATKKQDQAIALADSVALLGRWLRYDVLGLAGPAHAERGALYDFLVAELRARAAGCKLLGGLVTYLKGQRDDLLTFAAQLDSDFAALAATFAVRPELVRELFAVQTLVADNPRRWQREAPLRELLGARHFPLSQALEEVRRRSVRTSSLVENFNSRLRSYFFLRRHLGNDYLALLQFYLNHRRYPRSEQAERVDKSPAELLSGQSHAHWLELLGYTRFSRN
jgi:hypothetical protein